MSFATLPDRRAAADPDGAALSDERCTLTNSEFANRIRAAARHLSDLGVRPGDVVALKLTNRVEFVVLLLAAWRLSATVTPINPSMTESEVARQLEDSDAKLLVVDDEAARNVVTLHVSALYSAATGFDLAPEVNPAALALLIYTSGTTGAPKAVMLDHANLDAMAEMGRTALEITAEDRCLLILPLFHVNGIVVSVLVPLLAGASVVIAERFNPETFFGLVERERPSYFSAVPTIYTMLTALPDSIRPDTTSLRFGVCGAAPAAAELLTRFEKRFGFPLVEGYGLSEATCASTLNPVSGERRAGTVGVALPGQEIRIRDEDGLPVPNGVDGEVTLRGPNIMRGYLNQPEATARTLIDGWLRTGDIGHLDPDGYLTLVGRSKDLIIRGGENIYPKEIEDILAGHPGVLEAAVVGRPDQKWGEVVVAFVQTRPGSTIDTAELKALCVANLSSYKRPAEYVVVDTLAKNAVGKIDKLALTELAHSVRA